METLVEFAMENKNGVYGWKNISLGGKHGIVQGIFKMNKDGIGWRSKGGQSVSVINGDLAEAAWMRISQLFQLRLKTKGGSLFKFDGFKDNDSEFLKKFIQENYGIQVTETSLCTKGWNWGVAKVNKQSESLTFQIDGQTAFEIPLTEVAQAAFATNKSNEVTLEFHQDDTTNESESLVEMRLAFPKDDTAEGGETAKKNAESLIKSVLSKTDSIARSGKGLLSFKEIPVLTPRGRYDIEMFPSFIKMHGKTYDYKILFSSVVRLFQLPSPDGRHIFFVVSLEPPIRQGHTSYPHLVLQLSENEKIELTMNLPKEAESDAKLKQLVATKSGEISVLVPRAFKILSDKKITQPKSFSNKDGARAIKCSLKANDGFLFPLERSFFFVHKPPTHIRFEEIENIDFARVTNDSSNRTFDLSINLKNGTVQTFKSLHREEYSPLFNFITNKKITILNFQDVHGAAREISLELENESKQRASRNSKKDVRLRVRQAMQQDKVESDEDDDDFGFNAENPEEDDIEIGEGDGAISDDLEGAPEDDVGVPNQEDEEEKKNKKKRKRDEDDDGKTGSSSTKDNDPKTSQPPAKRPRVDQSATENK
eukprot:TRINITY_DN215_c0_g1_i1.p1 TRINITY_DN215_c0_g1~~TRINITY_DN215_c0_g1_i1.p1  ORF type:complete len:595 (-),score=137.91 TRINITY_DN215_c0_g1_i1:23-1807(-)